MELKFRFKSKNDEINSKKLIYLCKKYENLPCFNLQVRSFKKFSREIFYR